MPPAADPPTSPPTAAAAATTTVTGAQKALPPADIIDMATFGQILEMDDDEESEEFTRAIVAGFLEQAEETFVKMDASILKKDLEQLSSLGHFLKGSSATLGLIKVKDYCEKIQHFGDKKDETGDHTVPDDECLKAIQKALDGMRQEYEKVVKYFEERYPTPVDA